jgi:hypothetical protein
LTWAMCHPLVGDLSYTQKKINVALVEVLPVLLFPSSVDGDLVLCTAS